MLKKKKPFVRKIQVYLSCLGDFVEHLVLYNALFHKKGIRYNN